MIVGLIAEGAVVARTNASEAAGDRARSRILDAALEVFAAKGYRAGSLDDIARLAGVTRSALIYHFKNKQGLLTSLLARRDADTRIMQKSDLDSGEDPTAELMATIRLRSPAIRAAADEMKLAHLLEAEAADPAHPAREWAAARANRIRDHFAARLAHSFAMGAPDGVDARSLAAVTLAVIHGLETQWLIDPDGVNVDRALETFEALVLTSASVSTRP
jgi:AcrR family transcriptional regulator